MRAAIATVIAAILVAAYVDSTARAILVAGAAIVGCVVAMAAIGRSL